MKKVILTLLGIILIYPCFYAQQTLTDTVQLSEVTVSAEKRLLKNKDIPTSITSISINRLEAEKTKSLRNLSAIVPNFYMPEYGSKLTSPVYIRGVGSRINSPSVGLYVDRVPYFEKSAFAFDFADVERIEVLRGPQGTLYGKNTMGGIINVVTRAPRNYRELKLNADFGNYGFMKYNFSYNEPVSSKLAILLNGGYTERDGYFTNNYHNESVGSDFTKNGSIKIRYNPIKPLVLTYKIGAERSYEKGYPYGVLDSTNIVKEINYNFKSRYARDIVDNSLTASLYLDKFVLTSVSAVQTLNDKQTIDQDFMPKDYYQVKQGVDQKQFTEEIVLTNNNGKWIDVTAGLFGFTQNVDRDIDLDYGTDSKEVKLVPGNGYLKYNKEENSGMAAFGQATVKKIAGFIDITLGLRYDYEWNTLHYTYLLTQPDKQTLKRDTVYKQSFKELLPKLSIRFNINDKTSAYFTTSKGYRGGGFNTAAVKVEDEIFEPEKSTNYEFGVKSTIVPDLLSATGALFYIDWENQQVSQRNPTGGNMIKNAANSYSKGLEFELMFTPLKQLQIGGNFGYTKTKYIDYRPDLRAELNYKDNYIPFIPRYTYSAFVGYKIDLKSKYITSANVHLSAQGVGKQFWDDENKVSQKAYTLVNGSIGADTPWFSVYLWSKNIFNQSYYPYMFNIAQFKSWYAQKGNPLTLGVTLSVNISQNK